MDKPVRRLFWVFTLLFVALIVQLTYVQVWAAPDLNVHPANTLAVEEQMKVERGVILSADGVELAVNRKEGGYYLREYPQGAITSPWLGYNSLQYGRAGVERVYNDELSGQAGILGVMSYWDTILGRQHRGADLRLTIDMAVQGVAAEALGRRKGAVVALDPRSGAILAMVSYPRYDPNRLEELWEEINSDAGRPLLNRATQGLYPPGSVFKTVVAAAALETKTVTQETAFDDTGSVLIGGFQVDNYGNKVYGEHDFADAFASSINTTFAKIGAEMGGGVLAEFASRFGFGQDSPWPLAESSSRFPDAGGMDDAHVAQASYGQGQVLATPLQIALTAAAIANGGTVMKPYLVDQVIGYPNTVLKTTDPEKWLAPISGETAATLRDLMVEVVNRGTGTAAALSSVQVAGKTGTAEVADAEPHAWFAAFAPADDPRVVVAVLVENAGTGGSVAAPIARQVIAAALGL